MHAIALAVGEHELALPFSWQHVSLHAAGASSVRARIAPVGPNSVSIELADGLGLPVLSVGSMTTRPVSAEQLALAGRVASDGELFEVEWSPVAAPATVEPATDVTVYESSSVATGSDDLAAQTHATGPPRARAAADVPRRAVDDATRRRHPRCRCAAG